MSKLATVLFVDDDPYVRKILCDFLRKSGFEVLCKANAEDALAAAREFSGSIRMLITDVMMPGMSGPELARELTQSRPDLMVLLISSAAEPSDIAEPTWGFLKKPFPAAVLLEKIREMSASTGAAGAQG